MKLKLLKVSLGSVSLSLYSALGLCVLLLTSALWYEGNIELGLPMPSGYEFTIEKSQRASTASIVIFFLMLATTRFFEKRVSHLLMDEQENKTRLPFKGAVMTTLLTFVFYMFIVYAAMGKFVFSGFGLIFDFTVAGLVGLSTYLHLNLPFWENRKINKRSTVSEVEALKLEYDWCWKVINGIYWASILIVASVWFFWWSQFVTAVIPVSEWSSFAVSELTTAIVLQMIYIGLGLWFGIIGKLVGFSRHIPDQIRACKLQK